MPPQKKFVPRERKQKARQARALAEQHGETTTAAATAALTAPAAGAGTGPVPDTNMAEILPEEVRARHEQKARMRAELRAGQATQMSAKKAKRLEKYIETKLRKDESRVIQDRLAERNIDTAPFERSRDLGKGKRRRRAELQKQTSLAKRDGDGDEPDDGDASEAESDAEAEPAPEHVPTPLPIVGALLGPKRKEQHAEKQNKANEPMEKEAGAGTHLPRTATRSALFSHAPPAGSGLKRPLELDESGKPVIPKRQKRGGVKSKFQLETVRANPVEKAGVDSESDEWNGFSDSSANEGEKEAIAASEARDSSDNTTVSESEDEDEEENESENSDEESDAEDDKDGSDEDEEHRDHLSGFKFWAQQQRNQALGFQPTTSSATAAAFSMPRPDNFVPRPVEEEPLPIELQPTTNTDRKVFNVAVSRPAEMDTARLALPIVAEEQQIMEAIHENDVVVVSGGTGSGKTTQVPQFLYEAGYGAPGSPTPGLIGVTQPRRVAAVSMAKRVAQELGDHGKVVAYQIRFEGTANKDTAIKFMTDGVLLRELAQDIVLSRYSAVIVDEAHERSINTDVLIGILSRVNTMRRELNQMNAGSGQPPLQPLKLVIMSATLEIKALTNNERLFPKPPRVVHIEGRQFPVTVHFAQKTRHDYVDEAFRKLARGHRKLPPGGFLVFLTGEDEIQRLAKRLRLEINGVHSAAGPKMRISTSEIPYEPEDVDFGGGVADGEGDFDAGMSGDENGEDGNGGGGDEDDAEFVADEGEELGTGPLRMNVLPLYSKLPTKEQQRVFRPPPDGYRQVVLATNVAETSLTIPGIRYVFDCGRAKERKYNRTSGVQSFEVGWISKASASQRAGRAGRTGPGHCYRLFSSAVYEEHFAAFTEPEVLRMPIEGVVLQLKAMNVRHVDVFPFPTPPDRQSLARAERLLKYISALHPTGLVTEFGQLMSVFPLSPRFAKILLVGYLENCVHYVIALVAALSADEVFVRPSSVIPPPASSSLPATEAGPDAAAQPPPPPTIRTQADVQQDEERRRKSELFKKVHRQFSSLDEFSDALKLLQAVGEFSHEPTPAWCTGHFVHHKALLDVQKMRRQITHLMGTNLPAHAELVYQEKLPRPTDRQIALLKQMVAAGFVEHVAVRADKLPSQPAPETVRKPARAIDVPYAPLLPLDANATGGTTFVYIHPSSVMAHLTVAECPQYIIFSHLQRASGSNAHANAGSGTGGGATEPKVRMRALTDISGNQLAGLARGTPLLSYGKPIKETFLSEDGRERECWVVPYLRSEDGAGGQGWPLPATKVRQRKVPGRGWEVVLKKE